MGGSEEFWPERPARAALQRPWVTATAVWAPGCHSAKAGEHLDGTWSSAYRTHLDFVRQRGAAHGGDEETEAQGFTGFRKTSSQ